MIQYLFIDAHLCIVRNSTILNQSNGLLINSARNDRYPCKNFMLTPLNFDRNDLRKECLFSHLLTFTFLPFSVRNTDLSASGFMGKGNSNVNM